MKDAGPDPSSHTPRLRRASAVLGDACTRDGSGRIDPLALDLADPGQRRLGDYELVELIGIGGMGAVYRARQPSLERDVALKLLGIGPWASDAFVERFRREARNAARMQHPNIVTIFDVDADDDLHFYTMRLVDGASLAQRLAADPVRDPAGAARMVRTIAEAVDYAHRLGVLHLDLKPANVLVDEAGEPQVADFGLARRRDELPTEGFEISGTPGYMAPEQVRGDSAAIGPATDVWGLGAILHELLHGTPPASTGVQRPRADPCAVPRDLQAIMQRCFAHQPDARYASARELADDLGRFLEHRPVHARRLNVLQRAGRWAQREPRLAASIAIGVAVLLGGLVATTLQWQRAQDNAQRAGSARRFLVGLIGQASPDENGGKPFTGLELLEGGEARLARESALDAGLRAELTGLLGTLYWDIGEYGRAEGLLAGAAGALADPRVPAAAKAGIELGLAKVRNEKNQYQDAAAHAQRARSLADQDGDDDIVAAARRELAVAWIGAGRAAEADALLREAIAQDRIHYGEPGSATAEDRMLLGYALLEQSRLEESATLSRAAMDEARIAWGPTHSNTLYAMGNLAIALRNLGRFAEAEAVLREAVTILTAKFGDAHRETLTARSNLLLAVESQGHYAQALAERFEMLPLQTQLSANRPEMLAYAWKNIAADQLELGQFEQAQASAQRALDAWKAIEGKDAEWHSVAARDTLAAAILWQGRPSDAEAVLRATLAIERAHEAPSSIWINGSRALLADVLRAAHRDDEARLEIEAALAALPSTASPLRANLLARQCETGLDGKPTEASGAACEAGLAMARATLPQHNVRLGTTLLAAGRARLRMGQLDNSASLLREALAVRAPPYADDDPRVLEVEVALVETLRAQGRRDEAGTLRARIESALARLPASGAARLRERLGRDG